MPPRVPEGTALFYTTVDFDGRLNADTVGRIRSLISDRFSLQASLSTCTQVHGATVLRAAVRPETTLEAASSPDCGSCDALYSDERQVALGIKMADCLPVTIIDAGHGVLANIHSGWRGAVQSITARTVEVLQERTTFDPRFSLAFLGPSIRVCCFEVGEEVAVQFPPQFIDRTRSKPHVDLPALTTALLEDRGFSAENVVDPALCTRCQGSIFHSYRREGKGGGRNLAIVAR